MSQDRLAQPVPSSSKKTDIHVSRVINIIYNKVRTEGSPNLSPAHLNRQSSPIVGAAVEGRGRSGGAEGGQWRSPQQLVLVEFGLLLGG